MGSGDRFKWGYPDGLLFGVTVHRFPFNWTITLCVGPVWVSYGFGKGYDE